jgi:hypothetical protein
MFRFRGQVNGNVEESLNYINGIAKFRNKFRFNSYVM